MRDIQIKVLDSRASIPKYATEMSAGMDLCVILDEPTKIYPGECKMLETGISIYIGDPRWAAVILPRSGLGHKHGIVLGNTVGLIDADYQGPLMLSVWNRGENPYTIQHGDRMAQLVFFPVACPTFTVVSEYTERTDRNTGGFGSTGVSADTMFLNYH